jgi:hypothetical protein
MRSRSIAPFAAVIALSGLLAGCGDSGSGPQSSAGDTRGVIASASDCVSFGADAVKACADAIEKAVTKHEASSQSYPNLSLCEREIGADKCERTATGHYRPRLSAFMVVIGPTARAEPLYPVSEGVGFQTADKSKYLAEDRSIVFSSLALSVAEMQSTRKRSGSSAF